MVCAAETYDPERQESKVAGKVEKRLELHEDGDMHAFFSLSLSLSPYLRNARSMHRRKAKRMGFSSRGRAIDCGVPPRCSLHLEIVSETIGGRMTESRSFDCVSVSVACHFYYPLLLHESRFDPSYSSLNGLNLFNGSHLK